MKRFSRRGHPRRPHMETRRKLLALILDIARRDGLDHCGLSECCGMTRPRASNLLRGRIEKFNSETLIDVLAQLGVTVTVEVVREQVYARFKFSKPRPGWRWPEHFAPRYLTPDWRVPDSEGGAG